MEILKRDKDNKNLESTRGNLYRRPDCDVYETDDSYTMYFDIPGVEKKDINLKVEKDILALSAECSKQVGKDYSCIHDEMFYSGFKRSFELGESIDTDSIEADYANGTLRLNLKKKENQKTKQIEIKVS